MVMRVVGFLRAGYPEGVTAHDYVPLLALLRRRLSDDEVVAVGAEVGWPVGDPSEAQAKVRYRAPGRSATSIEGRPGLAESSREFRRWPVRS